MKALKDVYISEEEFTLILSQLDNVYPMKDELELKSKIVVNYTWEGTGHWSSTINKTIIESSVVAMRKLQP